MSADTDMVAEALLDAGWVPGSVAMNALDQIAAAEARWLAWSSGDYPDESPGDVIAAETDGTIVLDDGITTWNPLRALVFFADRLAAAEAQLEKLYAGERLHSCAWREVAKAAEAQRDTLAEALREVVHQFNMWSEDANDGTYAYWKNDGLMVACVAARAVLAAVTPNEEIT